MIISLHWRGGSYPINIFISKDRVVVSRNALINETSLVSIDIPINARGKQFYFWLTVERETMNFIFSGAIKTATVTHPHFRSQNDDFWLIYVSDSPFTINRALITKNTYNTSSDAYSDIKEYEKSEGTFI